MPTTISDLNDVDRLYHALGRFLVSFSYFQSTSELMVVNWLCPSGKKEDHQRAWAVISGQTIQPVVDSLFSLCIEVMKDVWSENDFTILRSIRKEINLIISERNRIAHDIWSLGHPNKPLPENSNAERVRFGRSPAKGAFVTGEPVTVEDLNLLIEKIDRLRSIISELGAMELSKSRKSPSEKFEVHSDKSVHIK